MKRLTVLALMFSCTAVAEAASKPLDGRWKWLKSTCERKTINEVMTEMTTMNVTLKNGAGKIELNIMPPLRSPANGRFKQSGIRVREPSGPRVRG